MNDLMPPTTSSATSVSVLAKRLEHSIIDSLSTFTRLAISLLVAVILLLLLLLCVIGFISRFCPEVDTVRALFWITLPFLPPALHAGIHASGLRRIQGK